MIEENRPPNRPPLGENRVFDTVFAVWSPLPESNQRPTDYKSVALPAELRRHFVKLRF
jgi:hypothetical protein